jgi:hypothetical protein
MCIRATGKLCWKEATIWHADFADSQLSGGPNAGFEQFFLSWNDTLRSPEKEQEKNSNGFQTR